MSDLFEISVLSVVVDRLGGRMRSRNISMILYAIFRKLRIEVIQSSVLEPPWSCFYYVMLVWPQARNYLQVFCKHFSVYKYCQGFVIDFSHFVQCKILFIENVETCKYNQINLRYIEYDNDVNCSKSIIYYVIHF